MDEEIEIGIVEEPPKLQWVQLPNNEPSVVVGMLDVFGQLTKNNDEAVSISCVDRFGKFNVVNVTQELISRRVILQ